MSPNESGHVVPVKKCATCGQEKPTFKFKRRLSIAETRARGGIGNRRMEVVSKNCTECRKTLTKPISKRTTKELVNLNYNGQLSDLELHVRIEQRKQKAKTKMKQAVSESWDKRYALAWSFYIDACQAELRRAQDALKYVTKKGDEPELLDFYTAYVEALTSTKALMQFNVLKRVKPTKDKLNPNTANITEAHQPNAHNYPRYMPAHLRRAVTSAWGAVPLRSRSSRNRAMPEAVFWHEPEKNGDTVSPSTTREGEQ